jgi:uncharacterized membrane protein
MNQSFFRSTLTITLFAPLASYLIVIPATVAMLVMAAIPVRAAEQEHHHYKLIDIGTFGGPLSYFNSLSLSDRFGFGGATYGFAEVLNARGILVGGAATSAPDPFPNSCFANPGNIAPSCFASHAFQWQKGVQTDLGTLPGGANSLAMWISPNALIAGVSQNGSIDPLSGVPELRAVFWKKDQITDLGTLGGNVSMASAVNNRDQIVGAATNATPDPFSFVYLFTASPCSNGTQTRAVLWDKGVPHDLGTLGGPDAAAFLVNQRGHVAGVSYTNSIPNLDNCFPPPILICIPTVDPFLWDPKTGMRDLGNFGDQAAAVNGLNNRGEVVGGLWLPGNQQIHPFLWDGKKLIDMVAPPFGGTGNGEASWINESGEVVGLAGVLASCPSGSAVGPIQHAFLWRNGLIKDLGALPGSPNSEGDFINSRSQIVGLAWTCDFSFTAVLWENDSVVDLNTLVPANSPYLFASSFIDDRGEIAGLALFANSDIHAVLLIPCDEGHPNVEGCDYSPVEESEVAASHAPLQRQLTPNEIDRIRGLVMSRQRGFMPRTAR